MSEKITETDMVNLNESPEVIGFLTSSEGAKVVVTNPDQSTRELNEGDVIRQGDILTVKSGSDVVVTVVDGSARLLPKAMTISATEENFSQLVKVDGFDEYPEFQELLGLIEDGGDITEVFEEPAAGEEGPSGDEIGQGLQFTLTGGETIPVAGIDPELTIPPSVNATTINTDQQVVSDGQAVQVGVDNNAPVAHDDAVSTTENTPIIYTASQLLGNDFDADGDVLVINSVTSGSGGTIVLNTDGTVTFTPDNNFSGVAEFTYTVSDGTLVSTPATVFVTVDPINDPTLTNPDVNSTNEDTDLIVNAANGVLSNDSDADDSLNVVSFTVDGDLTVYSAGDTASIAGVGDLTLNGDGSYSFSPESNYNGPVPVATYTTNTGVSDSLTLSVAPINDPTLTNPDVNSTNEDTDLIVNAANGVLSNDSDADDSLNVVSFTVDGDLTVYSAGDTASIAGVGDLTLNGDGSYSFSPESNYNGPVPVATYTTNTGVSDSLTLSVAPINDPTLTNPDVNSTNEDTDLIVNAANGVLSNDSDADDSLNVVSFTVDGDLTVYSAGDTASIAGVGDLTLNGDGSYSFSPESNYNGPVPVATYTTNTGVSDSLTLSVAPINDPTLTNPDVNSTNEDTDLIVNAANGVLSNDSDADDSLNVVSFTVDGDLTVYSAGDTASIAGVGDLTLNGDGSYSFSPESNYNGPVPVATYTTNTGVSDSLTLSVAPINDPTLTNPDVNSTNEDTDLIVNAANGVLSNDSDADDSLNVVSFTVDGDLTVYSAGDTASIAGVGDLTLNGDGSYSFSPESNYNGPVPVATYTTNTGVSDSLTLSVAPINDPTLTNPDVNSTNEDTDLIVNAANGVLSNDSDADDSLNVVSFTVDGDLTVYSAGDTASIAGVGDLTLNGDGSYSFSPESNYNGPVPVATYTTNTGVSDSLTLSVAPINDPTLTNPDVNSTNEDTDLIVNAANGVLSNDSDADDSLNVVSFTVDGDLTVYSAGDTASIAGVGDLTLNGDGSYSFSPESNYNGPVPVATYTTNTGVSDSLTLSVAPINDPTLTNPDVNSTNEDTDLIVNAANGVLSNDSDADDSLNVVSFTVDGDLTVYSAGDTASIAGVGDLTLNGDGSYSFSPESNYNGPVPVATYTTNTGVSDSLTLSVAPINDPTLTNPDVNSTNEDTDLIVNAANGVLSNDSDADDSLNVVSFTVDGDLTVYSAGDTASIAGVGDLTLNGDGSYSFSPESNYNGPVPVATYTTNTGVSDSLTLSVAPINDPTLTNPDVNSTNEDTDLIVNAANGVLSNDSDADDSLNVVSFTVDGDLTVYSAGDTASIAGVGDLTLNGDGSYSFSPESNYNGPVPVATYTTNTGVSDSLTLSVAPINDPTLTNPDVNSTNEDTDLIVNAANGVLSNDSDADDSLNVVSFTVDGDLTVYSAGDTASIAGVGDLTLNGDGSYSFSPESNYNGPVPVATYTTNTGVSDSLTLSVAPINDPTLTNPDVNSTNEDTDLIVNAANGVLSNDSDADDSLNVVSFTVDGDLTVYSAGDTASIAGVGDLTLNGDGSYSFSPESNYNGPVPVATYTTNTGVSDSLTLSVAPTPANTAPSITAMTAVISEEGIANANPDSEGIPSDTTDSPRDTGTMNISDVDGDTLTVVLSEPDAVLTSGGNPIVWSGDGTSMLVGSVNSDEIIRVEIDQSGNYSVTLSGPLDHPVANQEDVIEFDINVTVDDGTVPSTAPLTIQIEDDSPLGEHSISNIYVGIDTLAIQNLQLGWENPVFHGGNGQVTLTDSDDDPLIDDLGWGRPISGNGQSGYTLDDNSLYTGHTGSSIEVGPSFKLADFQHLNYPIYANSSTLDEVTMTVNMDVVVNGVAVPISVDILIDHNETPNSGGDSRDIITLPPQAVSVTVNGQSYDVQIDGFRDTNGNIVSVILTDENATNSFEIMGSVVSTGSLPTVTGSVGLEGADGAIDHVVWGDTDSDYGTMSVDSDGNYSFEVFRDIKDGLQPGESITETFSYSVTDHDGDTATATLTINIGGYLNVLGSMGVDNLNGTALNEYLIAGEQDDSLDGAGGNDILLGGLGNDLLTGGSGEDVFLWKSGDAGAGATDTIADFTQGNNGDVLDFKDLLESGDTTDLSEFLSFSWDDSDTTITIDVDGAGDGVVEQSIVLQGVDITANNTLTGTEIIENLTLQGNIITD